MHTCNNHSLFLHSATGQRGFPFEDWQNQVSEENSSVKEDSGPGPGGVLFPFRERDPFTPSSRATASTLSIGSHRNPQLGGEGGQPGEGGAGIRTISGNHGEGSHGDTSRGGLNLNINNISDRTEDTNLLSETSGEYADNSNVGVILRDSDIKLNTTTSRNPNNFFVGGGPITDKYENTSESSGQTRTRVTLPVPGPTPASTTVQAADTFLPHLRNIEIETPTTDALHPQLLSTETTTTTTEAFLPQLRDIETDVTATTSEEESSIIAAIFQQVQDVGHSEEVGVYINYFTALLLPVGAATANDWSAIWLCQIRTSQLIYSNL